MTLADLRRWLDDRYAEDRAVVQVIRAALDVCDAELAFCAKPGGKTHSDLRAALARFESLTRAAH